MANTAEIRNRIESIQETRKITNAMYLIASIKLRRARRDLERTRPYFDALRREIKRIFRTANDVDSPYFYPPDREPELSGTYGCLVITADKGMAGSYNLNVLKEASRLLQNHRDIRLFVVGEDGRRFFDQHHIPIEHMFHYTAQNPTLDRAREISSLLLEQYDSGDLKKSLLFIQIWETECTAPSVPPDFCPSTEPILLRRKRRKRSRSRLSSTPLYQKCWIESCTAI